MIYNILEDSLLSLFMGAIVRTCVRDALKFRRNKKQFKTFMLSVGLIKRLFCLYSPSDSNAPNNMRYFQCFRIVNVISFCIDLFFLILRESTIWEHILLARIILLYVPFVFYILYAIIKGPSGHKTIDFSIFKNP